MVLFCFKDDVLKNKINEIVNKFLLVGDKLLSEIHLRQPAFTYTNCGPFNKNRKRIQTFKKPGYSRYNYQNELDKNCFKHDAVCGDFKDLLRRTASDKILSYIISTQELDEELYKPIIRKF